MSALEQGPVHDIEVLLCHAVNDPVDHAFSAKPYVRFIKGSESALIPELWRDGIYQAKADKVATLTAHCVPKIDWLETALSLDMEKYAGYGGVIELSPGSDGVGAAIHLLRYAMFTPPQQARDTFEIAADNAVYRRDDILACADLLAGGFWEPSFHSVFKKNGAKMALHPGLVTTHRNQYKAGEFMKQRRLHGQDFGRARADGVSLLTNLAMLVFSPAAYFIYGIKLVVRTGKSKTLRRHFLRAAPWLALFLGSWIWGEATGYAESFFSKMKNQ
ncbi:MAG: hypothetical protein JKX88_06785 [Marinicaulis sp.]|nr:hypothetical protein [Marinicaulis sp.]